MPRRPLFFKVVKQFNVSQVGVLSSVHGKVLELLPVVALLQGELALKLVLKIVEFVQLLLRGYTCTVLSRFCPACISQPDSLHSAHLVVVLVLPHA